MESVKQAIDGINIEETVKEIVGDLVEMIKAVGRCFETERLRVDSRVLASLAGLNLGKGGGNNFIGKPVTEYNVVQNLGKVSSDKGTFRQWHQKFLSAIGQVREEFREMIEDLVRYIDLGKPVDKAVEHMEDSYGIEWSGMSKELYHITKQRRRHTRKSK